MQIAGFNRVELIVDEEDIDQAVQQFNEVLGLHLPSPHPIEGRPVLSATDFGGYIELVAPIGGEGGFGEKLRRGPGQIGPLVWEVASADEARSWLQEHGYRIVFEYDSRLGNESEQTQAVYQLICDPAEWFGFNVTFMQRFGSARSGKHGDDPETNKRLVGRFCELYTTGDWTAVSELLGEDFRWSQPTSSRRQSSMLADAPVLNAGVGYSKTETLDIFDNTVKRCIDGRFDLIPLTLTAEADRVSVEARGYAVNAANGRTYDNHYHHLFVCRAGKIIELREYQDTLLLFDVWMAP
jgi:ketosteroid isomerase-like protein